MGKSGFAGAKEGGPFKPSYGLSGLRFLLCIDPGLVKNISDGYQRFGATCLFSPMGWTSRNVRDASRLRGLGCGRLLLLVVAFPVRGR